MIFDSFMMLHNSRIKVLFRKPPKSYVIFTSNCLNKRRISKAKIFYMIYSLSLIFSNLGSKYMLISKKCYNFLFIYSYQTYSINKDVFNQYGEEEGEEIGMVS